MRIVTLILAILFLIAGTGLGLVRVGVNFKHADSMDQIIHSAEKIEQSLEKGATAGSLVQKELQIAESFKGKPLRTRVGGVLMVVCGIIGLAALVTAFIKKSKLVLALGIAALVMTAVMVFINPAYEVGRTSAAAARSAGLIVSIPLTLGILLTMVSDWLRRRKAQAHTGGYSHPIPEAIRYAHSSQAEFDRA